MRTLSSSLTFGYKFIFPIFWIGVFGIVTLLMFAAPDLIEDGKTVREIRSYFLFALILGGTLIYWSCMRLKKVSLDRDYLYISNFSKVVKVNLRDVERVSGSLFLNPELVWLRFRSPTEFGEKIVFMGKWRLISGWTRHPVVNEIEEKIDQVSDEA